MAQTEALKSNELKNEFKNLVGHDVDVEEMANETFDEVSDIINQWSDIASVDSQAAEINTKLQTLYGAPETPENTKKIKELETSLDVISNTYFNKNVFPKINNLAGGKLSGENIPSASSIVVDGDIITITPPLDGKSNTKVMYTIDTSGKCTKNTTMYAVGNGRVLSTNEKVL